MVVLILSIILIGLAVLERILYIKRNKIWYKMRLLIGVLSIFILFLISYFVTDSTPGLLYVFLCMSIFILIGLVIYRSDKQWLKHTAYIIGIPTMAYLITKAIHNMLVNPQYILLLSVIVGLILSYSYKRKRIIKETISFILGFVIAAALLSSYYKTSNSEDRSMIKQELVAKKYTEEELGINGASIYTNTSRINLRGEDITVKAFNPSGPSIIMIYKNGKIISYDVKND
ncbi:MAG: hypothetical protein RBR71_10005 [Gudongella sp.]|nr:hypothetical protein [Gudongella sp.]